jgi:type III pantothenate kinase
MNTTPAPRRWLLDLGNTRLKFAPSDATGDAAALDTHDAALPTQLVACLGPARTGDEAWLASVAPADVAATVAAALRDAGYAVHRARSQARRGRLQVAYGDPSRLGVDRFLALLAASERDDGPWLLVSAGSALTVDLLQADGVHVGGLIAPMPDTMGEALASRFPALDVPRGEVVDFATDTGDAIASGCARAAVGLVEHAWRRARARLGVEPMVLLGGGAAGLLADVAAPRMQRAPTLVLDGLAAYARTGAD